MKTDKHPAAHGCSILSAWTYCEIYQVRLHCYIGVSFQNRAYAHLWLWGNKTPLAKFFYLAKVPARFLVHVLIWQLRRHLPNVKVTFWAKKYLKLTFGWLGDGVGGWGWVVGVVGGGGGGGGGGGKCYFFHSILKKREGLNSTFFARGQITSLKECVHHYFFSLNFGLDMFLLELTLSHAFNNCWAFLFGRMEDKMKNPNRSIFAALL